MVCRMFCWALVFPESVNASVGCLAIVDLCSCICLFVSCFICLCVSLYKQISPVHKRVHVNRAKHQRERDLTVEGRNQ
jgi:hypothetical protein